MSQQPYDPYQSPQSHDPYQSPQSHDPYQSPQSHDPYQPPQSHDPYQPPQSHDLYQPPQSHDPYQSPPPYDPYQSPPPVMPTQPVMPMQPQEKHTRPNTFIGIGSVFALLVVIIIVGVIVFNANAPKPSSTNNNTNSTNNTNSSTNTGTVVSGPIATTAPATQSTFEVGQVVNVANIWQITVLSAKTSVGSQYNVPQTSGDVFLVLTVSVKNISAKSQIMSSMGLWTLQDNTGQKYNTGFDLDAGATLDGTVGSGRPLKGVITYEVPTTIHSFTLSFQSTFISADQTYWAITV